MSVRFHTHPSFDEALAWLQLEGMDAFELMLAAGRVREAHFGREIRLCSIVNAKSGNCGESCGFCAQSAFAKSDIDKYKLVGADEMVAEAKLAESRGAREFSLVFAGRSLKNPKEIDAVCDALRRIRAETSLQTCVSAGLVDAATLDKLIDAGLQNVHHNVETARSFHPQVVKTHTWAEEVEVIHLARSRGIKTCCGGIIGMGESLQQRVEMAMELAEIQPDHVPLNFLNPIPGTPLGHLRELTPLDCLKLIAVYRLILPKQHIFVCGGRELNLRDLQALMFMAGADGTMAGNYLTTKGRDAALDIQMIRDMGLVAIQEEGDEHPVMADPERGLANRPTIPPAPPTPGRVEFTRRPARPSLQPTPSALDSPTAVA